MRLNSLIILCLLSNFLFAELPECPYVSISRDDGASKKMEKKFRKAVDEKFEKIKEHINTAREDLQEISNLQGAKYISNNQANSMTTAILMEIEQTNYLQEKQNKILEMQLDLQIAKLNSKIIELEQLLVQLKKNN